MRVTPWFRLSSVVALFTALSAWPAAGSRPSPPPSTAAAVHRVTIVTGAAAPAPVLHGAEQIEAALRAHGIDVGREDASARGADLVVVLGTATGAGPAAAVLAASKAPVPSGAEALTIRRGVKYQGRDALLLAGADASGAMYAALDTADRIGWTAQGADPLQFVRDTTERPFLTKRGLVMFAFNQAYFEGRLRDVRYLTRYLDTMADDRINELALTFGYEDGGYLAPIYPYFFDVEGFPDVKVVGLTPEQQSQDRDALRTLIRLAADRGIRIKPGLWDHIYRGGVQRGGIAGSSDGSKPTPGLVWGVNAGNLVPYTVAGLKRLYEVFPEFRVTQFRMHDESGLLQNEIAPFWHDVFGFFSSNKRDEVLELRVKGLDKSVIRDAQAQGLTIELDTKVWMEQMGLPFHPTKINPEDQQAARHSYADLLEYPKTYPMNWTLWNGGTARVLLWADPEYARRLVGSARLYDGRGLTVTEMEATKALGDPHTAPPHDAINPAYHYFDYEFERYWAFYRVWGRTMYSPDADAALWREEYVKRFGAEAAPHVEAAVELASRVLPRIVAASTPYRVFPTTQGWPEMMHFGSLPSFAQTEEGSDVAQFMNVREGAKRLMDGADTAMQTPEAISRWFTRISDDILAATSAADRTIGSHGSREFTATMADAKALAALARYHAWRQIGALNYNLYKQSGDLTRFDDAVADEGRAIAAWRDIVASVGDVYSDNMSFGPAPKNFPRHWKDELKGLDTEFAALQAERAAAQPRPNAKPAPVPSLSAAPSQPSVVLRPDAPAIPGQDHVVQAAVTAPAGVKWMRLRYRHVNQKEDYQTVPMTRNPSSGLYTAAIPGAFITAQWDVMYYVEIVDAAGTGRIFPDLEVETPYVVVPERR